MTITIQYFALLQDEAGRASEELEVAPSTPREVYEQVRERHNFSLNGDALGFAVNDAFVAADHPLQDGDKLVFIPPVAGG